jgi:hypothetical protein
VASYGRSDSQETTETTFYNMIQQHPMTPPPELVQQWLEDAPEDGELGISKHIATQAARWGADQELEACCEWTRDNDGYDAALALRADRRPKPPSLKAQALAAEMAPLLAAAIRAAADQVVPEYETTLGGSKIWPSEPVPSVRARLLAIADELEAQ